MLSFSKFLTEALIATKNSQLGSNPGGIHVDTETNEKHYIKKYKNPEQAKVESLTGKIYKHMGIHTLDPELHDTSSIKTKWNEHVKTKDPSFYNKPSAKHAAQIGKMYHAAVLTKNWDIVGLDHDNVVHNSKTDNLHAIDHGGAFHFRAQGGHKDYSPDNAEKNSLRHNDQASGHVFSSTFKHHPDVEHKSLDSVKNMDMGHVHGLFKDSGLKDWKHLHDTFVKRRNIHLKSYED